MPVHFSPPWRTSWRDHISASFLDIPVHYQLTFISTPTLRMTLIFFMSFKLSGWWFPVVPHSFYPHSGICNVSWSMNTCLNAEHIHLLTLSSIQRSMCPGLILSAVSLQAALLESSLSHLPFLVTSTHPREDESLYPQLLVTSASSPLYKSSWPHRHFRLHRLYPPQTQNFFLGHHIDLCQSIFWLDTPVKARNLSHP